MNRPKEKSILTFELIGILFIVILGSLLHFTFELSGYNLLVGAFSAVNESVWEHLKLSYWPAVTYAIIEYRYLKNRTRSFFQAKAMGIYAMPLVILTAYYTYTAFMEESLLLDISIFVAAVVVGQLISYKLLNWRETSKTYVKISIFAISFLAILFILFTYYPPRISIFQDPVSGSYGIKR